VRLPRSGRRMVVDGGATRAVHLDRIANTGRGTVVRQVGAAQRGPGGALPCHHVAVGLESLLSEVVRCRRRVQGERRVADVDDVTLADHIEPLDAREPGDAVGGQRRARALAVRQHATAGEHIRFLSPHLDPLPLPAHGIDQDLARPAACRVRWCRGLLVEGDDKHCGHHWFGRVNVPPLPTGLITVTTLKSGSDVNPCPMMCCPPGSSKTNIWSELTWLLD